MEYKIALQDANGDKEKLDDFIGILTKHGYFHIYKQGDLNCLKIGNKTTWQVDYRSTEFYYISYLDITRSILSVEDLAKVYLKILKERWETEYEGI